MNKMRQKNSLIYTCMMLISMILVSCLAFGVTWAYFSDRKLVSGNITFGRLDVDLTEKSTSITQLVAMEDILPGQYIMGSKDSYRQLTIDLSNTNINTFLRVKVDVTLDNVVALNVFNVITDDKWVMHYDGYLYPTLDPSSGAGSTVYETPKLTNQTINIKIQLKPSTSNEHMNLSGSYSVTVEAIQADYLNSETATTTYTITELADIWTTSTHNQEIFIVEDGVITGLSEYAKTNITSLVIPSTTTSIGANAFSGCKNLTSVVIPDTVTEIGEGAFQNCTKLKSITIPDGVTSIESRTFNGCTSLSTVIMPDSVTAIKEMAFHNCTNLTNIVLSSTLKSISSQGFYNSGLTSIELPEGLTTIGGSAFTSSKITEIYIPASVTYIQGAVNTNLTKLIISPDNARYTSRDADGNECNCVMEIATGIVKSTCSASTIPSNATTLAGDSFCSYNVNKTLYIPKNIVSIQTDMRYMDIPSLIVDEDNPVYTSRDAEGNECNVIIEKDTNTLIVASKNCTIPDTVTKIADKAFVGKYMQSIVIPKSVVEIDGTTTGVFTYNSNLTSIIVDEDNPVFTSRDSEGNECNVIVKKSTNSLIAGCTTSVIPDNVSTIATYAFMGTKITTITIPTSVTKIERAAFYNTPLTSATFTSPTGWKVTYDAPIPLDLSDPATNAKYLSLTYHSFEWTKE